MFIPLIKMDDREFPEARAFHEYDASRVNDIVVVDTGVGYPAHCLLPPGFSDLDDLPVFETAEACFSWIHENLSALPLRDYVASRGY